MIAMPSQREMERATLQRDAAYDGAFFVCVRTTGIFCRPTCPARKPSPKNVEYLPLARLALLAGYRPCKRCRPMDANGKPPQWVEWLFDLVERSQGRRLRDADLRAARIEPTRARRYFNEHYGMTFQAYHRTRRMGLALAELQKGKNMLHVAEDCGFESSSGFRDAFERIFGTTPGRAKTADCIRVGFVNSPVGPFVVGATDDGVCLMEFLDRRALQTQLETLRRRFDRPLVPGPHKWLKQLERELGEYFASKRHSFDVPLVYPGTDFQRQVWDGLLRIPFGQTRCYEDLAKMIGRPGAQRAVGKANGDNRLAILIPCHRVVGKNGKLVGYGGQLWRKQFLLDLEREAMANQRGGTTKRSA